MYSSASAMSHALEELVGHVDRLQRRQPSRISGWSRGRSALYIVHPRHVRQGIKSTHSSRNARREKGRRGGKPKPAAEVLDRLERKYIKMAKDSAKRMRAHFTPQAEIDLEA